jgi:hypothetical protein
MPRHAVTGGIAAEARLQRTPVLQPTISPSGAPDFLPRFPILLIPDNIRGVKFSRYGSCLHTPSHAALVMRKPAVVPGCDLKWCRRLLPPGLARQAAVPAGGLKALRCVDSLQIRTQGTTTRSLDPNL